MDILETKHFINGKWIEDPHDNWLMVTNPASQEVLAQTPVGSTEITNLAVQAAMDALPDWKAVPAGERIQPLYRLKVLLELERGEIERTITLECGKTIEESRGEIQRAIENIEVACGIPSLLQGDISENIAPGIDELMLRQPLGVCAAICPFNFPAMIAFWFFPYALACGNTFVIKPSERVSLTMQRIFELIEKAGFPKGVINLVNGGRNTADALIEHPGVKAISFVGSTPTARHIYSRSAALGKRSQCQGGAKNPVVVLPDADQDMTIKIIADSAFGCAGQRCLAASLVIPVGNSKDWFSPAIAEAAYQRVVGFGMDSGVQMGPVISTESKVRIEDLIQKGIAEGAKLIVDGRNSVIPGYEKGNFIRPTVLEELPPEGELARTEVFGPVLGILPMPSLENALDWINHNPFGNMASLFTASGAAARKFRHEADAGNIGINIGVAAPLATFPFSGWKDSFFGDLHGQSMDAVNFFTQKKVVVERWPKEWSRTF
jgi:malonate-semialdehyde dehydrogenase (acetylating)/methylmalonate-semialdehyde dehydrogenase